MSKGDSDIVRWLLENARPDLGWKNFQGKTAFTVAVEHKHEDTVDLLVSQLRTGQGQRFGILTQGRIIRFVGVFGITLDLMFTTLRTRGVFSSASWTSTRTAGLNDPLNIVQIIAHVLFISAFLYMLVEEENTGPKLSKLFKNHAR